MGESYSADYSTVQVFWGQRYGQRYGQRAYLAGINLLTVVVDNSGAAPAVRSSPRSRNISSWPANPPPVEQQACASCLEAAETVARRQTDWRRADNCEDERRAGAGVGLDDTERLEVMSGSSSSSTSRLRDAVVPRASLRFGRLGITLRRNFTLSAGKAL